MSRTHLTVTQAMVLHLPPYAFDVVREEFVPEC